jgi:Folylpolyglutamate synthase
MKGVYLTDNDISEGVSTAFNPGRMEIVSNEPTILLDGAHNPAGMKMLRTTLKEDFEYDKLILTIGILEDKDIEKMLSAIVPISDIIVVTKSKNTRACEPNIIRDKISKFDSSKEVFTHDSIEKAIIHAKLLANKEDIICISGSLFTVGEARSFLLSKSSKKIMEL